MQLKDMTEFSTEELLRDRTEIQRLLADLSLMDLLLLALEGRDPVEETKFVVEGIEAELTKRAL